ncbi:hypothetical protein [Serratia fonticola]|uniref:hypothetical protein n=1 Tax=Serratia fonticola TaxID=47917 RepID=UPI0021AD6CFF|nr:hypothetical protein [Serratia fonticola]
MKVSLTVAADDRKFSKAYSRIYPDLKALTTDLSGYELKHPIGERITVIVTDTEDVGYFKEDSKDGDFTYFVGMQPISDDVLLKAKLFDVLRDVFEKVLFTIPDREQYRIIFSKWESKFS